MGPARINDPMLPSSASAAIAEVAVSDAWRLFSDEDWTALLAEDRAERGEVDRDPPPTWGSSWRRWGVRATAAPSGRPALTAKDPLNSAPGRISPPVTPQGE